MKQLGLIVSAAAILLAGGCNWKNYKKPAANEPGPAAYRQAQDLQNEIDKLNEQLTMRNTQQEELARRSDALADEVRKYKFLNEQQARQIRDLSRAPLERDEYKRLVDDLKVLNARQSQRLAEIEGANRLLEAKIKSMGGEVPQTPKAPQGAAPDGTTKTAAAQPAPPSLPPSTQPASASAPAAGAF
ncbi:MAG: hypothetical protein LLG01_16235 [Planctomycetaceae bacterium]|nr:hypothetical protein [Planctomycetaceae bacterium]